MGSVRMLATILVLCVASEAGAQSVEDAEALYRDGAIESAVQAFQSVIERGSLDRAALARAQWHLGVLSSITGATAEAEYAFTRALGLDPNLRVPDELPPEAQATYRDLQGSTRRIELIIGAVDVSASQVSHISVELRNAPSNFVTRVRARSAPAGSPPWTSNAPIEAGRINVPAAAWRGSDSLSVVVDVTDRHGNVVASASTTLRASLPQEHHEPGPERSSVVKSPWLWLGVLVVVGAVVSAILLSRREADIVGGNIDVVRDGR